MRVIVCSLFLVNGFLNNFIEFDFLTGFFLIFRNCILITLSLASWIQFIVNWHRYSFMSLSTLLTKMSSRKQYVSLKRVQTSIYAFRNSVGWIIVKYACFAPRVNSDAVKFTVWARILRWDCLLFLWIDLLSSFKLIVNSLYLSLSLLGKWDFDRNMTIVFRYITFLTVSIVRLLVCPEW